jgi:hypothetical protein
MVSVTSVFTCSILWQSAPESVNLPSCRGALELRLPFDEEFQSERLSILSHRCMALCKYRPGYALSLKHTDKHVRDNDDSKFRMSICAYV